MARSPAPNLAETSTAPTKLDQVLGAVRSRHGATMGDLVDATGWQPQSIRAALTRLRQRGHAIERQCTRAGVTRYQLRKAR